MPKMMFHVGRQYTFKDGDILVEFVGTFGPDNNVFREVNEPDITWMLSDVEVAKEIAEDD